MLDRLWLILLDAGPYGFAAICLGLLTLPWVIWRRPLVPLALQLTIGAVGCIVARRTALHAALLAVPDQRAAVLAQALDVATNRS